MEATNLLWDEVEVLANEKPFYLIADVSNSVTHSEEIRRCVVERFGNIKPYVNSLYAYENDKYLLRIALKFMVSSIYQAKTAAIGFIQEGLD